MLDSMFTIDDTKSEHANLNRLAIHYGKKWGALAKTPFDELTEIQRTQRVVLTQIIGDLTKLTGYVYVKRD